MTTTPKYCYWWSQSKVWHRNDYSQHGAWHLGDVYQAQRNFDSRNVKSSTCIGLMKEGLLVPTYFLGSLVEKLDLIFHMAQVLQIIWNKEFT